MVLTRVGRDADRAERRQLRCTLAVRLTGVQKGRDAGNRRRRAGGRAGVARRSGSVAVLTGVAARENGGQRHGRGSHGMASVLVDFNLRQSRFHGAQTAFPVELRSGGVPVAGSVTLRPNIVLNGRHAPAVPFVANGFVFVLSLTRARCRHHRIIIGTGIILRRLILLVASRRRRSRRMLHTILASLLLMLGSITISVMVMMVVVMMGGRRCGQRNALAALDHRTLHGDRTVHVVQFKVEATRVADGVSSFISSPQRRSVGAAVGTYQSLTIHLMLIEGGATIAAARSSGTIAMTVSRTRTVVRVFGGCRRGLLDGIAFQPGGTNSVPRLIVQAACIANRLSVGGSPPKGRSCSTAVGANGRGHSMPFRLAVPLLMRSLAGL